jgi:exosortase
MSAESAPTEALSTAVASPALEAPAAAAGSPHVWSERYRLARLHPDALVEIGLFSVVGGLLYLMFHILGNTTDVTQFGRSVLAWMVERWYNDPSYGDSGNYTHGPLIPLVSLAILWTKRREIYQEVKAPSVLGVILVALCLFGHYVGAKAQQSRVSLIALVGLLWALPYAVYGWKTARHLIFPVAFLTYCVPLQFLEQQTFILKMFATYASGWVLNGIGIPVILEGADIIFVADASQRLNVAEACSGLRSLLALSALSAIYGYLTMPTLTKKWLLFLSAVPLAMIGNVARIVIVAIIARAVNYKLGTGLVHDWGGFFVFAVAIGLMVAVGAALTTDYRAIWNKWTSAATTRT